ncbi:MAG: sensor histidine kinase [Cellvibrionaceae bacterium]
MDNIDYKAAYERQKKAREKVEGIIEERSRELYDINTKLTSAYEELKSQKLQMIHQEKLASVGQLSAGIAHEINNPVGFIKGNLGSLKRYTKEIKNMMEAYQKLTREMLGASELFAEKVADIAKAEKEADIDFILEDFDSLIDESIEGTHRIGEIIQGLKNFSRIDSDKKEVLLVNDCIRNTIKLVENEVKYKAELKLDLADVKKTMGYPGGLSQVILNLIVNAGHSIDEFGLIAISTKMLDQMIVIQIEDNGCGMDDTVANKIFDPFYTTKEVGVGTGLGLSISMGVIKKHGGEISVVSELGKGTCFTISLPVIGGEARLA